METAPKRPQSGTFLLIGQVLLITGLLIAANLRLRAHRKPPDSLAVLPFLCGTRDAETVRLSEEITRSIIKNLSSIPRLKVISEADVLAYRGPVLSPQRIGRELNVEVVVVGRIENKRNTVIIQTDLVNVVDESQLWGRQYERNLTDPDAFASEIAGEISASVRQALFPKH